MPVVVTSEWLFDELLAADEGTFSRMYEKSKGFRAEIKRDQSRNHRMKGATS